MRPIILEQTGTGLSTPAPVNYMQADFKIGFGVEVDGTVTYSVQHTFDLPSEYSSASDYNTNANWYDHESVFAQTTTEDGNYAFPIRAVRINVTAGTGTATGTFLQGM